ncbi:MAG: hypothetical protein WBF03_05225 [Xanthobacteraceae bacterium]|jgi:hypothetical protein
MRKTTMATMTAAAILALCAASGAVAKRYVYKDIRMPNGQERGMDAKLSDARTCGFSNGNLVHGLTKFNACMRTRGWALDHVEANIPSSEPDPPGLAKWPSKVVPRGGCLMGIHDCWSNDPECMDDPAHTIALYGCKP